MNFESASLLFPMGLLLIAAWPRWSHSARWGYGPFAAIGFAMLMVALWSARA